ncbi:MAG: hypothetical protein QOJ00_1855 [Actinomycetota bacterium]
MIRVIARTVLVFGASALVLAGCGGSSSPAVKLDGSPRVPDVEGVVIAANAKTLTLDGGRHYKVSEHLVSFSTYNRRVVALKSAIGDYVQLGLKGDTVVWLGRIGVVMTDDAKHQTVAYQGVLTAVSGARMTFKDGTVLRLAPGLKAPADARGTTYAVIDAKAHNVQGATFSAAPTTTSRP